MSYIPSLELMQEIAERVPDFEVRDVQVDALDAVLRNEQAGEQASLLAIATGVGKTAIAGAQMRRWLIEHPHDQILLLADNVHVLDQDRAAIQLLIGNEFRTGVFYDGTRTDDDVSVLFASFQSMREHRTDFSQRRFQRAFVDECHHGKARTFEPTIDYFRPGLQHFVGITATPDRHDILNIRDIFGPEVYKLPIHEAIAMGILADIDYHVITDPAIRADFIADDEGQLHAIGSLGKRLSAPARNAAIVESVKEYGQMLDGPQKTVIFCNSIREANEFAKLFGSNAAAYHSGISRDRQKQLLELFRADLDYLAVVSMFDEGLDFPNVTQIVFNNNISSVRKYLQQIGRGLRKAPGKERVQVLDYVNNADRILMVDKQWRKIADLAGVDYDPEDRDVITINMSNIHFDDFARDALGILARLSSGAYIPGQTVPEDSVRLSSLAADLSMKPAVLKALAGSLGLTPSVFPTHRGDKVLYVSQRVADLLVEEAISQNLFVVPEGEMLY